MAQIFDVINYNAGAIIYLAHDLKSDFFFIIKSGRVRTTIEYAPNHFKEEELGEGDFFGVIGCLSCRPRLETACALEPVSLMRIRRAHFTHLIRRNTGIIKKFLKFFSKRIRTHDLTILNTAFRETEGKQVDMFQLGASFYRKNKRGIAKHIFTIYCEQMTGRRLTETEEKNLQQARTVMQKLKDVTIDKPEIINDRTRRIKADNVIFCEGETGRDMYIIKSGKIGVYKIMGRDEMLLDVLHDGDIVGEMALLDDLPRSATAVTEADSEIIMLDSTNFHSLININVELVLRVFSVVCLRMWASTRHIMNLNIQMREYRIFDFLWFYYIKERTSSDETQAYDYDFNMVDLMKMLGYPADEIQSVRQVIMKEKIIDETPDHLQLLSPLKLKSLVETFRKVYENKTRQADEASRDKR